MLFLALHCIEHDDYVLVGNKNNMNNMFSSFSQHYLSIVVFVLTRKWEGFDPFVCLCAIFEVRPIITMQ